MALTESDLSDLLAAPKVGETTETVRTSLQWILQQLIEVEATTAAARSGISAATPAPPSGGAPAPAAVDGGR